MTGRQAGHVETLLLDNAVAGATTRSGDDQTVFRSDSDQVHLGRAFLESARSNLTHPALTTPAGTWTYGDLMAAALDVRNRLTESPSFTPCSRVLLVLPNSAEYIAAFYGTLLAGGVAVPLAPKLERKQFQSILQSTSARQVITQARIARASGDLLDTGLDDGGIPTNAVPTDTHAGELAAILFTGGSSGVPKGVMLSHHNLVANAASIQQYLGITAAERPLCVLPFYHAFGNSILQSHLLAGSHLIIDGNTAFPNTLIEAINNHRVTSLSGVPDLFRFLLERSSLGKTDLPTLSYMSVAGGALPHELAREVAARIAPAPFFVMYGQTEATARLAYLPPTGLAELGDGCIGRAIPGVELEVVDEFGNPVIGSYVGEIRARGANIMLGYWKDPALTSEVVRDGWLYTGDLATVDDDGWIYHRGRRNALIKIAGYRIHPSDVEDFVLRSLPVQQAVLVPFELPGMATRLALYVRPKSDAGDLTVLQIVARCRAELPRHMVPDEILLVDSFPLNDALKIDRPRLIAMASATAAQRRKIA